MKSATTPSILDCLVFGLLTGVVTGIADAVMIQNNYLNSRGIIQYVPWTVWPAAIAMWVLYGGVAGILFGLPPQIRRYAAPLVLICGPLGLGLLRVTQVRYRFVAKPSALIPVLLVLLVLGVVAGRACLRWMRDASVRSRLRPLLIVCATLAVAAVIALALQQPRSVRPAHSMTAEGRNVVVIFLDTLRYDFSGVGKEGAQWAPNLHRFSRSSLNFERAMAPAPWTLPSHVSMLTGVPAWELGLTPAHQTILKRNVMLAERFARAGYRTAAFIANPVLHDRTGFQTGMQTYEYAERNLDVCRTGIGVVLAKVSWTRAACQWSSAKVSEKALRFIDGTRQPYFLVLNYVDPHDPYWLPPDHEAVTDRRLSMRDHAVLLRVITRNMPLAAADRDRVMKIYAQAVRGMDASMKPLLERLDRDVQAGRTVVAIVGDHGEHFGEHNLCGHGNSVYAAALHVPLVIRAPGFGAMSVATPVSCTFLNDALQRLARGPVPPQASIAEVFTAKPAISHMFFDEQTRGANYLWSIFDERTHLIESDTHRELYASDDRAEVRDLSREGVQPDSALVHLLREAQTSALRPRQGGDQFKGLGYLP